MVVQMTGRPLSPISPLSSFKQLLLVLHMIKMLSSLDDSFVQNKKFFFLSPNERSQDLHILEEKQRYFAHGGWVFIALCVKGLLEGSFV